VISRFRVGWSGKAPSICLTIFMTPPASLLSASPEILGHLLIRSSARFLPSEGLALPISVEIASDGDAFDADGTYRKFFDAHGIVALIQRPDLCVFGVVDNMSQLSHLVDDLIAQIKSAEKTLRRREGFARSVRHDRGECYTVGSPRRRRGHKPSRSKPLNK
jgi:hypothetical protein